MKLFRRYPKHKIFCISFQRTGTTSVGKFLKDFNFKCSGWPECRDNEWSRMWFEGDFEAIFNSTDFRASDGFEDSPWFFPDFYKVLYHRFPNSRFILFERDPKAWFNSMRSHSNGNIIGRSKNHCKLYRREVEYNALENSSNFDDSKENSIHGEKTLKILPRHEEHYTHIYQLHNREVKQFFQKLSPESLHVGQLEDPEKWHKLGKFLGLNVPQDYQSHENISRQRN